MDKVIAEIAAERRRQVEEEGYCPSLDDHQREGELAQAAACYAMEPWFREWLATNDVIVWPWEGIPGDAGIKPKSRRRDLIRAAALIVAEIERLDRAEQAKPAA